MMILTKLSALVLSLPLVFLQQASKQDLNDQMFEAVRKGDAAAVTALLDKGADVNAKFRYGSTALFKAAERGNVEIVKVLLARGVDTNVKDSFYGATALTWAMDNNHFDVVKLLVAKMPAEVENVLLAGAQGGELSLVQAALDTGGAKPEALTTALAAASEDPKNAAIVEVLKKAGAVPPPTVDAATLQSYAGKYKGEPGPEMIFTIKEGKLVASAQGQDIKLIPTNATTFIPTAFGGLSFAFKVEAGKVVGVAFKQGQNTTQLKRVE